MSEDEARILAGYSPEMLATAIQDLRFHLIKGDAGEWERQRLEDLEAEDARRAAAKIDHPEQAAA